jgi:hypothetical protein
MKSRSLVHRPAEESPGVARVVAIVVASRSVSSSAVELIASLLIQ